ncbi:zinc finger MYM-type protein 1-like [Nematolebias whitei]|nr:zinc finger MYM-type protein 1-like [Nematolebias whitei]
MLDKGHSALVQENRRYMMGVVESLRYTACQGIAQRSHSEKQDSANKGNFREMLDVIGKFDPNVQKKLTINPSNAKYVHHDIQNEIFNVMAEMIRKQISNEVKEAQHFAILVDESKDISKKEQISVIVRYLQPDSEKVVEEFLHFTPAEGLDADSLFDCIKMTLSRCNIDINCCVGQCYDGAAVMSGCNNGVQEKLRKEVPQAVYIHCHAHRLNLVLVDCVHNVDAAADFFEILQMLYKFFSGSVVHDLFLKKQEELVSAVQRLELKRLSDTRWACQYDSIRAVKKTLPAVIATLHDVVDQKNAKRRTEAKALSALIDKKFVLHLVIFEDIFRTTKFMSDQLQSPNLDLVAANDLAHSVITALTEKRTDDKWETLRKEAEELCSNTGIATETVHRQKRQTQTAKHLEHFIVDASIERKGADSTDDLKTKSFYSVIDRMLMEMKQRFSSETNEVLKGLPALNPKHPSFLDKKWILPMACLHGVNEENLSAELHQVRRLLKRKEELGLIINNTQDFLSVMRPYKDAFLDLYKLISISLTLPVTSVSCERSFSCLRRLKNYLRNSSGDSRTSDLALLAINPLRTRTLDSDRIIDAFALNHNNRRIVLL